MIDIATNFEYKDKRTYVHSSTMCEFLSRRVVPVLGVQECNIRLDARFHRLAINNGIMHCHEGPKDLRKSSDVAAEFRISSGSQIFHVYFFEGQKPVVSRISSRYEIEDLKLISPFAGSCRIKIINTRSLLENTIEANKRLHQATFPRKEIKVINLYMKRFPLGFMPQRKGWYTLVIRHIGSRSHNDGLTTLNTLSWAELDIPAFDMCYLLPGVSA